MAGDWIKMRVDLQDDPAVVSVCDSLELDEFEVVGRLHKLWAWADKHTADGVTTGVTPKWVDRYLNKPGFAQALIEVGWLEFKEDALMFPGFEIHNGKSAKSRCDAVLRQRESRMRHAGVTNSGEKRISIPKPFTRAVMQRDDYRCVYCGTESSPELEASKKSVLSIDHIVPHSRGSGRQAIEDLATCCKLCNNEKNDRTPEEWGLLPTFLNEGVVYKEGTLVTEKCDTNVTKPLPEKRREEKSLEKEKARGEEFQICWSKWKRHLGQIQKPLSQITEETQLMQLGRIYPNDEDAIQAIEYSISVQAKNLILNGDHKPKPQSFSHASSKVAKSNDDLLRNLR
jgi:hypothetical protein